MSERNPATESRAEREARFQALLEEQARSGLSLKRFAEEKGVPYTTLSYWRRRSLAKARPRASGKRKATKKPVRFTAVRAGHRERLPIPSWAEPFEIFLAGGCQVRVPQAFQAEDLRRLLGVLRGSC